MQAMTNFTDQSLARWLPSQARFGVIPGGDSSAYAQTTPQQSGPSLSGIYAGVNLEGITAEGRISAGILAAVVVLLVGFHIFTKPLQL